MTAFSLQYPGILQAREHSRNGLYPDSQFYGELAGALNHTLAYRKKCVFTRAHALGTLALGGNTATIWRCYFATGYGTQKLAYLGLTGLAYDHAFGGIGPPSTTDPLIRIALTKVGGATANTDWHTAAVATGSPTDAPSEWGVHYTEVSVDSGSDYYIDVLSTNYARLLSLTVHEIGYRTVDDSVNYFTEIQPVAGGAILDSDIQRLVQGPSLMLGQNGALQANWCMDLGAARTTSSTSWRNIIDDTSASPPTATSLGWRFNTTGRQTRTQTGLNVTIAVYGEATGAGDGHVTLRNTGGTDEVAIDITGGAGLKWYTASSSGGAGVISLGTGVKLDPGFYVDASTSMDVYAISVFEDG